MIRIWLLNGQWWQIGFKDGNGLNCQRENLILSVPGSVDVEHMATSTIDGEDWTLQDKVFQKFCDDNGIKYEVEYLT